MKWPDHLLITHLPLFLIFLIDTSNNMDWIRWGMGESVWKKEFGSLRLEFLFHLMISFSVILKHKILFVVTDVHK